MNRLLSILAFLFVMVHAGAQPLRNDAVLTVHEETLNKVLDALGEVQGKNSFSAFWINHEFTWTLSRANIHLLTDSARFEADVLVETAFDAYTDHVVGRLAVGYDEKANKISIKLVDAVFRVRMGFFGKEITVRKVQLADYLPNPILFDGPSNLSTNVPIRMPDGSQRVLLLKPQSISLRILPAQIVVSSELSVQPQTAPQTQSPKMPANPK